MSTLGELLNHANSYMVDLFGCNHIKNLSYFLLHSKDSQQEIGYNYRNMLAHWSDTDADVMTPQLVWQILWLFTDILNTTFVYAMQKQYKEEQSDQL